MHPVSELRQDIVSGTWVVIALRRGKRPRIKKKFSVLKRSPATCRFKELEEPLLLYSLDGGHKRRGKKRTPHHPGPRDIWGADWWVRVVQNKFPALGGDGQCSTLNTAGPYQWLEGVGAAEVVITRDHERSFAQMDDEEVELVVRAYQDRYLALKRDGCVKYVSIFHNYGPGSGASVYHPHSQIITTPIVPLDVYRSLKGAAKYFKKHKTCVYCMVLRYEQKIKERIVYENDLFIAVTPYASKTAFEIRIFPKRHGAHFEELRPEERSAFANALRTTAAKLYRCLDNPGYNFFFHTAPAKNHKRKYDFYHWHLEILPKTEILGGFEIGTGMEVAIVAPEYAAKLLRKMKVKQ